MTRLYNNTSLKFKRRMLRNNMPKAEGLVWSRIQARQMLGFRFRRQYSIGSYIVDFYCPTLKLAIEIDGDSHFTDVAQENDAHRQRFIEDFVVRFLRFTNDEVTSNLDGVLEVIRQVVIEMSGGHAPL